ncbi:hypothetical protein FBD94_16910 [Pedobacter hiemivivus]|uniref:Uncharacterized protein n=1 Tax=Pedobacter hiemivivus TaxID=2530454 RepID=A0A4U1GDD6_9SPHI|nr:hypothetical protein [Pedobacter hiemivivus]TCC97220.1 hypothetical protein EZ444_10240 [Pedobacter hiemivivus]TKC59212.1 hypothetical protein FBD94_16910 [Pedobacter hiemivivus]
MKIISIFTVCKETLYAVRFDDCEDDEFARVFDQWNDVEYLYDFFQEHIKDLQSGFYTEEIGNMSIDEVVQLTLDEAEDLEERLVYAAGRIKKGDSLQGYFKPLSNEDYKLTPLQKNKAIGLNRKSWLRVYAIRISATCYVITGGAIKLTPTMNDRPHLLKELRKLEITKNYLKELGILDEDDFELLEL